MQHFHIKLYEKCVHGFHTLNITEIHIFTEVDAKLLWMNMKFDYCIQIIVLMSCVLMCRNPVKFHYINTIYYNNLLYQIKYVVRTPPISTYQTDVPVSPFI
jgi:hypothetical protein